jgi:peptidoglycan/LPS O-acetylase OafA/YrhL
MPFHWVVLIVLAATIPVSLLCYFYIELPSMNLGRRLSNRLRSA